MEFAGLKYVSYNDLTKIDVLSIKTALKKRNKKYDDALRFTRYKEYIKEPKYLISYQETTNGLLVPRYYPINGENYFPKLQKSDFGEFKGELRDYQKELISKMDFNQDDFGYLVNLDTGLGKTIVAIYIMYLLKVNTIIVLLTNQLLKQWKNKINKFLPKVEISKYNKNKKLTQVTLATYSQLAGTKKSGYKDALHSEFYENFNLIIFDEFHRAGAETFLKILERASCQYRLALTATFRRKDGMEKILNYHIHDIVTVNVKKSPVVVEYLDTKIKIPIQKFEHFGNRRVSVDRVKIGERIKTKEGDWYMVKNVDKKNMEIETFTGEKIKKAVYVMKPITTGMLDTYLVKNFKLFRFTINHIKKLVKENRNIILLSRRKEFLFNLYNYFKNKIDCGLVISTKDSSYVKLSKELKFKKVADFMEYSLNRRVIFGIENLAKEGMDVPNADTLIIVNPIKDIQQAVGRLTRISENKKENKVFIYLLDNPLYNSIIYGKGGTKEWVKKLNYIEK